MIIDLPKFIASATPDWNKLEKVLDKIQQNPDKSLSLDEVLELHYLYDKTASDLSRLVTYASEPALRNHLEALVARAYSHIHTSKNERQKLRPLWWLTTMVPHTFRKNLRFFVFATIVMFAGALFGALATAVDPEAKTVLQPFGHGDTTPTERIKGEMENDGDHLDGVKARGFSFYVTNNTRVALFCMALGFTWGIGTMIMLFYNGAILGSICFEYIVDGHSVFLTAWLLPHGSVEIPAILIGGQAGFLLARTMMGTRDNRMPMSLRFKAILGELLTLCGLIAILMFWAGIIEAYFSQYHEPVLPYWLKISFGSLQFMGLVWYLMFCKRKADINE